MKHAKSYDISFLGQGDNSRSKATDVDVSAFSECSCIFFRMQRAYLLHAIAKVWSRRQLENLSKRSGKEVKLAGDARCCSPGHTGRLLS